MSIERVFSYRPTKARMSCGTQVYPAWFSVRSLRRTVKSNDVSLLQTFQKVFDLA